MSYFPFGYQPIEPSTWAYLSSLLMLALFFKFNRFWSFRNFDLILLILLAPGLLMVHYGEDLHQAAEQRQINGQQILSSANELSATTQPFDDVTGDRSSTENAGQRPTTDADDPMPSSLSQYQMLQRFGYLWLFGVGILWLARLFYDPLINRKPMLEPNLALGGLVFLACSLMIFLFANVINSNPRDLSGPMGAAQLVQRSANEDAEELKKHGPGYPLLHLIPALATFAEGERLPLPLENELREDDPAFLARAQSTIFLEVARIMAILSQIAIIAGLIFVGHYHFGSFQMGVGMATVFLMLPYTAQFGGDSMHLLPGALLIWAIALFRRPLIAGVLIGLAAGVCYYPFFLLPLWISFYWERGRTRFTLGALLSLAIVVFSLSFTSIDLAGFLQQLKSIFGFWMPRHEGLGGIWALNWESWFRLPLLVAFLVLCISYAFWPPNKNLASLISCTAAAMIAVQYWHGDGGGLYMAWYLPLVLLVVFRPNLDDQIAVAVLEEPRTDGPKDTDKITSAA